MNIVDIANTYLRALQEADIDKILSLFSDDGIVKSPLYGTLPTAEFYTRLLDDTQSSRLTLRDIFSSTSGSSFALFFEYEWILINEKNVVFEVVDIIHLDENGKINALNIIYDAHKARGQRDSLKS